MSFAKVYPLLVAKAERKGRTKAEVDKVICWMTGYDREGLEKQLKEQKTEQEIIKYILATYQAELDTVEKDYYDFTKMLEQMNLTESDGQKEN